MVRLRESVNHRVTNMSGVEVMRSRETAQRREEQPPTPIPGPYDPTFSDVLLRCGETSFAAHKAILAAGSPVLGRLLRGDVSSLDVRDMPSETLRLFLAFLYSSRRAEALELYRVSGLSQVSALRDDCAAFLADGLALENVCDVLSLERPDERLAAAADSFLYDNFDAVVGSAEWSGLVERDDSVAGEVLTAFAKKSRLVKANCFRNLVGKIALGVFVVLLSLLMMMMMMN